MPPIPSRERFIQSASLITLSLTSLAAGCATLIGWFALVRRPLDLVIPPVMCVLFAGLLILQLRRPHRVAAIMRAALLLALVALAVPTWFYTVQAALTPGLQLLDSYPPIASLLLVLMVMAMLHLPVREGVAVVVLGWLLVALPVLAYLCAHPAQMRAPRGTDLLMTFGPVFILFVVLLPVQRRLTGTIQRLVSEQARMEDVANRDALTRIYNRRFGELVLEDMLAREISAGVIMFDMDRFKAINDTHGHPVGDQVLQQVAQCCQQLLRRNECLARWGGEEFLIAVPEVDAASLLALAERLRKSIAELVVHPVPHISASVGIALMQAGDGLPGVLQRVDDALYKAKKSGGNRVAS